MRGVLKYLILFIVSVVSWEAAESSDLPLEEASLSTVCLSETDSDFCLPAKVSFASPARVQSGARRTDNIQRNTFEFVKAGKLINSGIRCFMLRTSLSGNSSLSDPSRKLLFLGRLII